ncbi:hypothetical protein FCJ61_08580 [Burkholderia metallica]|nr:hypothetical protein [Burkholderia metallica]
MLIIPGRGPASRIGVMRSQSNVRCRVRPARYREAARPCVAQSDAVSGAGVPCNTSLNFNGAGFINRTSDLARYAREAGLDGFVARDKLYMKLNPR